MELARVLTGGGPKPRKLCKMSFKYGPLRNVTAALPVHVHLSKARRVRARNSLNPESDFVGAMCSRGVPWGQKTVAFYCILQCSWCHTWCHKPVRPCTTCDTPVCQVVAYSDFLVSHLAFSPLRPVTLMWHQVWHQDIGVCNKKRLPFGLMALPILSLSTWHHMVIVPSAACTFQIWRHHFYQM